jgi:RimJ/RimL family protein N-acetyltransferase
MFMLVTVKADDPRTFIMHGGYQATIPGAGCVEPEFLVAMDGSNEGFMAMLLAAIMDLRAEGKTTADIRYTGKSTRRWFQAVYPDALAPCFLAILSGDGRMIGYVVAFQSPIVPTRKLIGIALIQSARGKHVGTRVIKHVQDHLASIFPTPVTELNFETSRSNTAMMRIAEQLDFVEYRVPDDGTWKGTGLDRVRFTWRKES